METENQNEDIPAAVFNPEEARVIACLMEKQFTTPNNYPLTMNSLVLACNQKSSREPVMTLTEGKVGHIANKLSESGVLCIDYGERAQRYSHRMGKTYGLDRKELTVLAVLMLRNPQTINEILVRTGRMADFADKNEVLDVLELLIDHEPPLAVKLPHGPGRREERYTHCLCGPVDVKEYEAETPKPGKDDRLSEMEERITALEAKLEEISVRLEGMGRV